MGGIERIEGFKCTSCDTVSGDIDDAIACCGVEVTVSFTMTVSGTVTIDCRDLSSFEEATNISGDDLLSGQPEIDCDIQGDSDVNIDDWEVDITHLDYEEVEE
tara:strand:- start:4511 stop:4819 length:309 start_codon:yes stop_codon:yes gene_type:complete